MKYLYILMILSINTYALEVDSFTHRYQPVEDSLSKVDAYINEKLEHAVQAANKAAEVFKSSCNYKILRRKVKRKFVADLRGVYVSAPLQCYIDSKGLESKYLITTEKKDSIYQYVTILDKPLLLVPPFSPLTLSSGSLIGSDKYSHMFNLGYLYYRKFEHGWSTQEILKHGQRSESSLWGGFVNGIVSNADLIANFQGLRFYQQLFGRGIDPLSGVDLEGDGAIQCVDGKFKIVKQLTLADFIDDGMDEGINCNMYSSSKVKARVDRRLNELGMECPLDINKCHALGDKYRKFAKYLLDKRCY